MKNLSRRSFLSKAGLYTGGLSMLSPSLFAASIVTEGDKALTLQNGEEYLRTFPASSSWAGVRLVFLLSCDYASSFSNSQFAMGLCSGSTAGYGSATPGHFVGVNMANAALKTNGTVPWVVGSGMYFTPAAGRAGMGKIVNGVVTNGANGASGGSINPVGNDTNRHFTVIDFIKGDPWIIKFCAKNTEADDGTDPSTSIFRWQPPGAVTGSNYTIWSNTVSVDEASNGVLDAINIYWTPVNAVLKIHHMEVWRLP